MTWLARFQNVRKKPKSLPLYLTKRNQFQLYHTELEIVLKRHDLIPQNMVNVSMDPLNRQPQPAYPVRPYDKENQFSPSSLVASRIQ